MAHFYGVLSGARGDATRCGNKGSGMIATAASWNGAIVVELHYDEASGKNRFTVSETRWHGAGRNREIATGIVGED